MQLYSPRPRRIRITAIRFVIILFLLILGALPGRTPPTPAQAATIAGNTILSSAVMDIAADVENLSEPPVFSGTLDQAVRAVIADQFPALAGAAKFISAIGQVDAWTFGTSGVIPEDGGETEPQILLFLAEQRTGGWSVAIEHSPSFSTALARIPRGLLTVEQHATLETTLQVQGNGSMQLSLPWATGETQSFTGGPHDSTLSAIDFSGGSGIVRAAREGTAYIHCGAVSPWVRVDHGGGLSTNYFHLSGISISNGQAVGRGAALGRQSTLTGTSCLTGTADGAHVHFWISQNGVSIPINNIDIGGWTVSAGAAQYQGCMTRVRDGLRKCTPPYQAILNEGAIGSGSTPPNIPNQLAPANGSTVGSRVVTLQWQDTGDPDNAPRTYRDYSGWIWNADNSWTQALDWQTNTSWTVTVPAAGTYYWKVQSGDGAQGSGWTSTWSFNVPNQPPSKPNLIAPGNGSVSTNRTITLQWQDTGDPDNGPRTYRDYSGWIWNANNSWTQALDWQTSTSWTVTVPADGTYYWKIQSGDGAVGSGWTDTWSVTVNSIPNMPTNLTQSDAIHDILAISWQDNSSNEDGFKIYKWGWDGVSWEFRYYDTVGPNTTMFTDGNLNCASDYYYQVSAYNSFGESERAVWAKASTTACPTPAQPSNLIVSGVTESSVSLSWQDNSTDENGFHIYRWDWNGIAWDFYDYALAPANATSFTDTGLSCDAHYFYVISSYNSFGESGRVGFVEGITNTCGVNIPTPTAIATIPPTNTPTATSALPPTATSMATATPTATPGLPITTSKHWVFVPLTVR